MMKTKEVQAVIRLRLYPNEEQELLLKQYCGAARWVYNWGLQRWKQRYEEGLNTTVYTLANELVALKKAEATQWLDTIQAAGLQQALLHLGVAFTRFFKKQAAFPQFKKRGIRDSFSFPQYVTRNHEKRQLRLPKIGSVRFRGNLTDTTVIKTVTIVREGDGWYACIRTTKQVRERSPNKMAIGIDMGVSMMATVAQENHWFQHPHHPVLNKLIARINLLQERMSRKQRLNKVNSKNREKARAKLAKAYAKLTNTRTNHLHQISSMLVRRYGTIVVEDLKIKNMTKSAVGTVEEPNMRSSAKRGLNRVISKQAWGLFFKMLEYKCNWYGRKFIKVNPANTSRTCPSCNHIAKENRESQAVFKCVACGHQDHADHVGALNVLRRGLSSLATA